MAKKISDVPKEVFETMRDVYKNDREVESMSMSTGYSSPFFGFKTKEISYGFGLNGNTYFVSKKSRSRPKEETYMVSVIDGKSEEKTDYGGEDAQSLFDLAKNSKIKLRGFERED